MMRRKLLLAVLAWALILGLPAPSQAAKGINGSPAVINLFLNWQLRDQDLPSLARWDVVVLDANQQARFPDKLRKLRELNPSIKLLAYLPSEEYATVHQSEPPDYPFAKLGAQISSSWYAHDPNGNLVYFWPGQPLLNVTQDCPAGINGEKWNTFFPRFVRDQIMSTGLWDGVFLDNTFDGISHFAPGALDLNQDGKADGKTAEDQAWNKGMDVMLQQMRALNPGAIILGNGGSVYANRLNGVFFEHFPSWSWAPNWKEVRDSVGKNLQPAYTSLNVNTDNQEKQNDYQLMRYGLASALTAGSDYSFDQGSYHHDVLWWYDEYDTSLGAPRAAAYVAAAGNGQALAPAVWARAFQNGLVLVNSTDANQHINLPGVFEKLHGQQDASANDGSLVTSMDLAAHDGILLMRRSEPTEIRNSSYVNGSFVRVYDSKGAQKANGFFAQRTDAPSGATVVSADLDNDGADDLVTAQNGSIQVQLANGKHYTFKPFGKTYVGRISLAVGNANRDAALEIVAGREGAPPQVKVLSYSGKQLAQWNAYVSVFTGGVRVAIGDLDHDGKREIVTGAGPGGGPHIRIWKADGQVWGGGFFAFDSSESGGVSVAVGDVDGDGKDEIVVGSGRGAVPRVRVFDGSGNLKSQFTLGTQPLLGGIDVAVSDVNNDGVAEIVVSGLSAF